MTLKTNTNVAPYYDDYDPTKGFHRILFRPRTVQTRELTQLQTMLQQQISSLGSHTFNEGSVVIPGGFDVNVFDVSITIDFLLGSTIDSLTDFTDHLYVRGVTSGQRFRVDRIIPAEDGHRVTIMGTITSNADSPIRVNEEISFIHVNQLDAQTTIATAVVRTSGVGTVANVAHGVYFVRGFFVEVEEHIHVISRDVEVPNIRVGFDVIENVVTSTEDPTLLSNAAGEPNARAPGADRIQIRLQATSKDFSNTGDDDFIEQMRFVNGRRATPVKTDQYSLIGDSLARRTHEESGDYTVTQHKLEMIEHAREGNNGGVYPSPDGNEAKMIASVKPGISYVRGYRVENDYDVYVEMDKGRDTDLANNSVTSALYGGYFEIAGGSLGVPSGEVGAIWQLVNTATNVIGTFKSFSSVFSGGVWQVYVRDIELDQGQTMDNVASVRCSLNATVVFSGAMVSAGVVESQNQTLIFPLPVSGVRSITPAGGSDTTYTVMRQYAATTDGNGDVTINSGGNTVFNPNVADVYISAADGTGNRIPATVTLTGVPVGSSIRIDSTVVNTPIRVHAPVIKLEPTPRTKTLIRASQSLTFGSNGNPNNFAQLGNTDIVRLVSATDPTTGDNVISELTLDNGQTDSYYNLGSIRTIEQHEGRTIDVEYDYFQHGAGDYFAVDSYSAIGYDEIYSYFDSQGNTFTLSDSIDYRRSNRSGVVDLGDTVQPNSSIRADVEYYLGRVDTIIASSDGSFGVVRGQSAINPVRPKIPANAMRLYDLVVPPYTFNVDNVLKFEQDNSNYTMRDIGKLADRITRVEETSSLNSLEQSTINTQIIDPATGLDRFKNGIVADPMKDDRILDIYSDETHCAFREGTGFLYPRDVANAVDLTYIVGGFERDLMVQGTFTTDTNVTQPWATNWINVNPYAEFNWSGTMNLTPGMDFWVDTQIAPPRYINVTVDNTGGQRNSSTASAWKRDRTFGGWWGRPTQKRAVTTTTVTSNTSYAQGANEVINEEVIPYMRPIQIAFEAEGLRANTQLFAWFNNRNVTEFTQQTGQSINAPLITDEYGRIDGIFHLPNTDTVKFSAGSGNFQLADNAVVSTDPDARTTNTTAPFESGGTLVTTQQNIIRTRTLGITKRTTTEFRRYDPVAQSFAIDTIGGEFIDSIDVYFRTKSLSVPVTMELRGMENGIPTHEVLSRTVVYPDDVQTSADSTLATNFQFNHPVYLEQDREYCFVVLANTQDYLIYYGQLGERIIGAGEKRLTKQPHTGVMFVSANGSTWSPKQDSDLKFRMHRCDFNSQEHTITFRGAAAAEPVLLENNPFSTVSGSDIVTVRQDNHGLRVGDSIDISGSVGGNGILAVTINATHVVTSVIDHKTYTLTMTEANSTGLIPSTVAFVTGRYLFNQLFTSVNALVINGTDIKWRLRYTQADRTPSAWIDFNPDEELNVNTEGSYGVSTDFEIQAVLTTTQYLSPQIDMHGFTSIVNGFLVDPVVTSHSYDTRDLMFSSPSTQANLYVSALLPTNSNMRVYIKLLDSSGSSADIDWTEVTPHFPITNDSSKVNEYRYVMERTESFSGIRVKVEGYGDRTAPPLIKDFRAIVVT